MSVKPSHKPGLKLIAENPYRVLGIYALATPREVAAAVARLKAFAKVGKIYASDNDLSSILPPPIVQMMI